MEMLHATGPEPKCSPYTAVHGTAQPSHTPQHPLQVRWLWEKPCTQEALSTSAYQAQQPTTLPGKVSCHSLSLAWLQEVAVRVALPGPIDEDQASHQLLHLLQVLVLEGRQVQPCILQRLLGPCRQARVGKIARL